MRRLGGSCGAFASAIVRAGLMALALLVVASGAARAEGEQMLLPFQCTLDRGRVVLTPSTEKAYRLVSPRASHAFTACAPSAPNRCRTWQIHKFDVMCAGQRVPWLSVAAAVIERTPQRGRVDNGRLMLRLGPEWQRRQAVPAGFRHPFGEAEQVLTFPAGFAPALGSGVRFAGTTVPPPTVVDVKPEPKPEARATKAEARPELRPESRQEPRSVLMAEAPRPSGPAVSDGWAATVTPAPPSPETTGGYLGRGLIVAAVALFAGAGLLFARRRAAPKADGTAPAANAAAEPMAATTGANDDAALCAELVARAVNLHQAAREAVAALPNANLREILSNDLASIQRRLLSSELTADVADERWDVVRPAITKALSDLERIARIIAGVLSSQPAAPEASILVATAAIPETPHQAYEVLGVNPEASRTVVKKVVDGLRQSWHPDHARDTDDRSRREERMKQINTAWDLIRKTHDLPPAIDAEKAA